MGDSTIKNNGASPRVTKKTKVKKKGNTAERTVTRSKTKRSQKNQLKVRAESKPQVPEVTSPVQGNTVPPKNVLDKSPTSGEQKPPVSGDQKPPASGDVKPPVSGDQKPPASGDVKPPVSGDQKPPASGDVKPPVSGDQKPPVSGDVKPPVSGDQKPPASGDVKPPASGDQKPPEKNPNLVDVLRNNFGKFDLDNNGFIDQNELNKANQGKFGDDKQYDSYKDQVEGLSNRFNDLMFANIDSQQGAWQGLSNYDLNTVADRLSREGSLDKVGDALKDQIMKDRQLNGQLDYNAHIDEMRRNDILAGQKPPQDNMSGGRRDRRGGIFFGGQGNTYNFYGGNSFLGQGNLPVKPPVITPPPVVNSNPSPPAVQVPPAQTPPPNAQTPPKPPAQPPQDISMPIPGRRGPSGDNSGNMRPINGINRGSSGDDSGVMRPIKGNRSSSGATEAAANASNPLEKKPEEASKPLSHEDVTAAYQRLVEKETDTGRKADLKRLLDAYTIDREELAGKKLVAAADKN